jgi:hypothetical protein
MTLYNFTVLSHPDGYLSWISYSRIYIDTQTLVDQVKNTSIFLNFLLQQKFFYCQHTNRSETAKDGFRFLAFPFQRWTWIWLGLSYGFSAILIGWKIGVLDAFSVLIRTLLRQNYDKKNDQILLRFLLFLSLSTVVILALYESGITSRVILPDKPKVIQTMTEILDPNQGGYKFHLFSTPGPNSNNFVYWVFHSGKALHLLFKNGTNVDPTSTSDTGVVVLRNFSSIVDSTVNTYF